MSRATWGHHPYCYSNSLVKCVCTNGQTYKPFAGSLPNTRYPGHKRECFLDDDKCYCYPCGPLYKGPDVREVQELNRKQVVDLYSAIPSKEVLPSPLTSQPYQRLQQNISQQGTASPHFTPQGLPAQIGQQILRQPMDPKQIQWLQYQQRCQYYQQQNVSQQGIVSPQVASNSPPAQIGQQILRQPMDPKQIQWLQYQQRCQNYQQQNVPQQGIASPQVASNGPPAQCGQQILRQPVDPRQIQWMQYQQQNVPQQGIASPPATSQVPQTRHGQQIIRQPLDPKQIQVMQYQQRQYHDNQQGHASPENKAHLLLQLQQLKQSYQCALDKEQALSSTQKQQEGRSTEIDEDRNKVSKEQEQQKTSCDVETSLIENLQGPAVGSAKSTAKG